MRQFLRCIVAFTLFYSIDGALAQPAPLQKQHREIAINPDLLDAYVGRYELAPNLIMTVTREGNRLFAQLTNQEKFELFPEGDRELFYKVVDAQITFEPDSQGRPRSLVLHQNGRDIPGRWIGNAPKELALSERKEVAANPQLLTTYVGRYQLNPNLIITITNEGGRLYAQLTGQQTLELFAESDRDFFFKVVDAQITFLTDGQSPARAVILHQHGRDFLASRIPSP